MQNFVIFCKSFLVYIISASAKTYTRNGALTVLGIRTIFTNAFLHWSNILRAC